MSCEHNLQDGLCSLCYPDTGSVDPTDEEEGLVITDPEEQIAAWRRYHQRVGKEWDQVEDVEKKLGRDG